MWMTIINFFPVPRYQATYAAASDEDNPIWTDIAAYHYNRTPSVGDDVWFNALPSFVASQPLYEWAIGAMKLQFNEAASHNIFTCPTAIAQGIDAADQDSKSWLHGAGPTPAVLLRHEFKRPGQHESHRQSPNRQCQEHAWWPSFRLCAVFRYPQSLHGATVLSLRSQSAHRRQPACLGHAAVLHHALLLTAQSGRTDYLQRRPCRLLQIQTTSYPTAPPLPLPARRPAKPSPPATTPAARTSIGIAGKPGHQLNR